MLIAIISDIHDNLPNLEKCLAWCKKNKIEKIICCGDVCNYDTLEFLSTNFSGEIFLVEGNGETYEAKDINNLKNISYRNLIGIEKLGSLTLGFCHQEREIPTLLKKAEQCLDFIFFGHSHKPWLEKQNNIFIANPGNLAGTFFQPTFASLNTETKELELKILHDLK